MAGHWRVSRRSGIVAGAAVGIVVAAALAALLIVRAAGLGQNPDYSVPTHWHDTSPPATGPVVSYAVSPDVPGLIVACIGDRAGNQSASPMGPATLWRTRDSGAHWQPLGTHAFRAGCELAMPRGGHGTIFAYNLNAPTPDQDYLLVSHDAGDTWRTVATDAGIGTEPDLVRARYDAIAAGAYRDSTLYAAVQPLRDAFGSHAATQVFSASRDDGRTWMPVESAPDALVRQGFVPLAIAPDYSTPNGWLRLLAPMLPTPSGQALSSPAIVQRSDDDGRTWHTVAPIGPAASDFMPRGDSAMLLTSAEHPGRVCALLEPVGTGTVSGAAADVAHSLPNLSASVPIARAPALQSGGVDVLQGRDAAALAGPPAPISHSTVLAASEDGGAVWSAWVIGQHQRDYGGAVPPGLAMDARGDCYVADQVDQFGTSAQNTLMVYRAAPGSAHPAVVASLKGQAVTFFSVSSAGGDATDPRLFVLATVYSGSQMIVCQGDICPPEPPLPRPHLLWTAPAA